MITIAYVLVGVLLWRPIPLALPTSAQLLATLGGFAIYLLGIALYGWGFFALGSMFGVSSGLSAELYEGHRLIDTGPYSVVRHPMYLGVLLAATGAVLVFRTWAMALFAPNVMVVIFRARREERLLQQEFGEAWQVYRRRVPAWIPRLRWTTALDQRGKNI